MFGRQPVIDFVDSHAGEIRAFLGLVVALMVSQPVPGAAAKDAQSPEGGLHAGFLKQRLGQAISPKSLGETTPHSVPVPGLVPGDSMSKSEEFIRDLRRKRLVFPIAGADVETVKGDFYRLRDGHIHHAVDILAPRHTPILAVDNGKIAKLFLSKAGGITIYHFDPSDRYVYYYAHLQEYASGLAEGDYIRKGQVIGYVGTSGNAPATTPHLHFSISRLDSDRKWWTGTPIDPYEVFR